VLKGFVIAYATTSADFLFREYELEGPYLQMYKAIMALPWALKPIVGVISDTFPIMGYKKAPYIVLVTLLAMAGFGYVALSPDKAPLAAILGGLLCGTLQSSVADLLTEAKYSEKMREHTEYGPDLVTYVWSGVTIGGLAATSTVGLILQYGGGPKTVYAICAIAGSIILLPTCAGYLEEEKMTIAESSSHTARMVRRNPEIMFLAVMMAVTVLLLGASGIIFHDIEINFFLAVSLGLLVIASFGFLLRPIISLMTVFGFVQTACALSIEGGTFYFFTDTESQYPEGPHFTAFFYTTVVGLVAGICGLLGLWTYNRFMKAWTYRWIYLIANVAVTVLNLVGLILYTRANITWGIPDKVFVLCGSVMQSLVLTWMWIPGVVMLAHLCPKGLEASMYALLAGCHNIGSSVAQYSGAYMLNRLEITPNGSIGESGKFENLWIAVLVSAVLPLFSLAFLPICIPNISQTEKILDDHHRSATVGSPYDRLRIWAGYTQFQELDNDEEQAKEEVPPEIAGHESNMEASRVEEEVSPLIARR
jgi:folate/biopterin transporter